MRFLLSTFHAGGNVPPFVELGRELVRRGHDVTCIGQTSLRGTFEDAGVTFGGLETGVPYAAYDRVPVAGQSDGFSRVFHDPGYGADLLREAARRPVDLTVVDCYLFGAMAVLEAAAVPTAILVHTFYGFMQAIGAHLLPSINETRVRAGLPACDPGGIWAGFERVLVTSSPLLDTAPLETPANLRYVGPLFDARPETGAAGLGAGDTPHVLVALSTTYMGQEALLVNILDALATLPVTATLTVGPEVDREALAPPPNVTVTGWLRHASVMARSDLVITHGGHGTVSTALAAGVPVLCVPLGRDQPFIAARVAALGAGLQLASDASAAEIQGAVVALLENPEFGSRARELSVGMAGPNQGVTRAADELEAVAARRGG